MVMAHEVTREARAWAERVVGLPIPPMRLRGSGDAKGAFWGAERVLLSVPDWQSPQEYAAEYRRRWRQAQVQRLVTECGISKCVRREIEVMVDGEHQG